MSSAEKPRVLLRPQREILYGGIGRSLLRTLGQHAGPELPVAMEFALCFDDRLARELREAGQVVHVLGATRVRSPRSVHAARKRLSQVIEGGRFDVAVCHSAWPHALFSPVVRAHGLRLAHYMHDAAQSARLARSLGLPDAARPRPRKQHVHRVARDVAVPGRAAAHGPLPGRPRGGWAIETSAARSGASLETSDARSS